MDHEKKKVKQAVALEYDPSDEAPRVIASGKGILAEKIIEKAQDTHSLFLQIVRSHLLIYIPRLSGIQPLCFPPFATLSFTMR